VFDGRLAEDFKLSSGTWVSVGPLRSGLIAAGSPLVQDVVITGHDRDFLAALIFPRIDQCRALCGDVAANASTADVLAHPAVVERFRQLLDGMAAQATGSARRVERALLLAVAPSIDASEITDKGSINQHAVLVHRAALVEELYQPVPSARILCAIREKQP